MVSCAGQVKFSANSIIEAVTLAVQFNMKLFSFLVPGLTTRSAVAGPDATEATPEENLTSTFSASPIVAALAALLTIAAVVILFLSITVGWYAYLYYGKTWQKLNKVDIV